MNFKKNRLMPIRTPKKFKEEVKELLRNISRILTIFLKFAKI